MYTNILKDSHNLMITLKWSTAYNLRWTSKKQSWSKFYSKRTERCSHTKLSCLHGLVLEQNVKELPLVTWWIMWKQNFILYFIRKGFFNRLHKCKWKMLLKLLLFSPEKIFKEQTIFISLLCASHVLHCF